MQSKISWLCESNAGTVVSRNQCMICVATKLYFMEIKMFITAVMMIEIKNSGDIQQSLIMIIGINLKMIILVPENPFAAIAISPKPLFATVSDTGGPYVSVSLRQRWQIIATASKRLPVDQVCDTVICLEDFGQYARQGHNLNVLPVVTTHRRLIYC